MAEAAFVYDLNSRDISFKATVQTFNAYRFVWLYNEQADGRAVYAPLFYAISRSRVGHQLKRSGDIRDPKREKQRIAYVMNSGVETLHEFFLPGPEVRHALRHAQLAKVLAKACKAASPKTSGKKLCWHDLRHSYAIHLIRNTVPLTLVAQSLAAVEAEEGQEPPAPNAAANERYIADGGYIPQSQKSVDMESLIAWESRRGLSDCLGR